MLFLGFFHVVDPTPSTPARPSAISRCPRAVRDFVPAGLRGPDCYCPEAKQWIYPLVI